MDCSLRWPEFHPKKAACTSFCKVQAAFLLSLPFTVWPYLSRGIGRRSCRRLGSVAKQLLWLACSGRRSRRTACRQHTVFRSARISPRQCSRCSAAKPPVRRFAPEGRGRPLRCGYYARRWWVMTMSAAIC